MNELDLREVTKKYLHYNNLTVAYMARVTKISETSLRMWLNFERKINQRSIAKIKDFLAGKYFIDADTIVHHILLAEGVDTNE